MTPDPLEAREAPGAPDGAILVDTRRDRTRPQHRRRRRRWVVVLVIATAAVVAIAVGITSTLLVKGAAVSSEVFKGGGSVIDLVKAGTPLKTDANGRTNIVIFGTSQDDPGHLKQSGGGGLWLTDSIQILSIDATTKDVAMVAVPRDLWVKLPVQGGKPCMVGYYSKINAVYECGSGLITTTKANPATYAKQDAAGAKALSKVLGQVTGLVPQYWVHVDYSVLRDTVNAVGGIEVHIVGDGANGIYDTNLDSLACRASNDISCRNVYYPHNGTYHLSGQQALNLARARGDANQYAYKDFGLNGGDFDRQANQQKIIVALRKAATSAGVLANPVTVFNLMTALGNDVTTSLSTGEAKTLIGLANGAPGSSMKGINLTDKKDPMLTTGWVSSQSVVLPRAGTFSYGPLKTYIQDKIAALGASASPSATSTPSASPAPSASSP